MSLQKEKIDLFFGPVLRNLGYFDEITDSLDKSSLESVILSFNDQWIEKEPQILTVEQGELRKFENMMQFISDESNPKLMI